MGVTLAGKTTDANGCVFLMLPDNTEVDVTPSGVSFPFYFYTVEADAVELAGIEWWHPTTTNWSTGDLYVLTNSTVTFRGKGNVPDVPWPTNALTWTAMGQTCVAPQVSVTFNTLSTSVTNPYLVSVSMADKAFTNQVVVCGASLITDPVVKFPGRNLVRFGIGEEIDVVPVFKPDDFDPTLATVLWEFTNKTNWTSASFTDRSRYEGDNSKLRAFAGSELETIMVRAFIRVGPSDSLVLHTNLPIIEPTSAIMKAELMLRRLADPTTVYVCPNPEIGHTRSNYFISRRLSYYVEPSDVSLANIRFEEGEAIWHLNGISNAVHYSNGFLPVMHVESAGPVYPERRSNYLFSDYPSNTRAASDFASTNQLNIELTLPIKWRYIFHQYPLPNVQHSCVMNLNGLLRIRKAGLPSPAAFYEKNYADADSPDRPPEDLGSIVQP